MREDGGFEVIKKAILNLSLRHKVHIEAYGEGNERRLTGKHETASINTFSWVLLPNFEYLLLLNGVIKHEQVSIPSCVKYSYKIEYAGSG